VIHSECARRDFLKLTSLAVVGFAGSGLLPTLAFAKSSDSPVSLGYSSDLPADGGRRPLTAASSMLVGDPSFLSREAKITVRSSFRATAAAKNLDTVSIDVVYPELGVDARAYPSFRAWTTGSDGFRHLSSQRATFRVPVDGTSGLQLNLIRQPSGTTKNANTGGKPDATIVLGLGSTAGQPKLQRGVYVVAYRETTDGTDPSWDRLDLVRNGSDLTISGGSLSYAIFTVDYAR
jgi:hypothetical protein